jgi:N-ethylmaleimide reductase
MGWVSGHFAMQQRGFGGVAPQAAAVTSGAIQDAKQALLVQESCLAPGNWNATRRERSWTSGMRRAAERPPAGGLSTSGFPQCRRPCAILSYPYFVHKLFSMHYREDMHKQDAGPGKRLFDPVQLGLLSLTSRLVMSSMSRDRSPGGVPTALNAQYYAQRASAALVVTESTAVSARGVGWPNTPGIYTPQQVAGWRRVTDAVHQRGGRIFLQLWHCGRNSHPLTQPGGALPIGPSALLPEATIRTAQGRMPLPVPHELTRHEIPGVVDEFRQAARAAQDAGFDGVQVHAGNGFLLDQFLRDSSNRRRDAYGGTVQNRCRLLIEVVEAVCAVWGRERVGVRLSPANPTNYRLRDSDPALLLGTALAMLDELGIAYVDVVEGSTTAEPPTHALDYAALRRRFRGLYVANNGFRTREQAEQALRTHADLISFGRPFIANPDLPLRLQTGAPLNPLDAEHLYSPDHRGYTDYPFLDGRVEPAATLP